jgi:hypothetical protein
MRWKSHVRFGGRAGETHRARAWQGAPVRPLLSSGLHARAIVRAATFHLLLVQPKKEVTVSARRMPMFKTKDVLRMHFEAGLSRRQIARALSVSRAGVQTTITRAEAAGLTWPLPEQMTDAALEARLYPPSKSVTGRPPIPLPDWAQVRSELTNKHVTRRISVLWDEYRATHPDGIGYSQYCDRYRQWLRHVDPVMRIAARRAGYLSTCSGEPKGGLA